MTDHISPLVTSTHNFRYLVVFVSFSIKGRFLFFFLNGDIYFQETEDLIVFSTAK